MVNITANQLKFWEIQENKRANLARENENLRSNTAKERENYRSNVAKETETHRANVANERENHRYHDLSTATALYGHSVRGLSRLLG